MSLIENVAVDDVLTRFGRWFNRQRDTLGFPSQSIEAGLEEMAVFYPRDPTHNYMRTPATPRNFREILFERKPQEFEIAESIVFDPSFPKVLFEVVYIKYFVFSENGKKVRDKDRWVSLGIKTKGDFYAHLRIAHRVIEEKWNNVANQMIA